MPNRDGTGPGGKGQGTSRKAGPCYNEKFEQNTYPKRRFFRQGAGLNNRLDNPQGRGLGPYGKELARGRRGRW